MRIELEHSPRYPRSLPEKPSNIFTNQLIIFIQFAYDLETMGYEVGCQKDFEQQTEYELCV